MSRTLTSWLGPNLNHPYRISETFNAASAAFRYHIMIGEFDMRVLRILSVFGGLSLAGFLMTSSAWAEQPAAKNSAAKMADGEADLDGQTLMDVMEMAVDKDPQYSGPAYLYPPNRKILRRQYLPVFFDSIDTLHETQGPQAEFIFGSGDQIETVTPVDISDALLFLSKSVPDKPINEELWGSLTAQQLFTAFDIPKVRLTDVEISWPESHGIALTTHASLSTDTLSVHAEDEFGVTVYRLEMPIRTEPAELRFSARGHIETYTVEGITGEDVRAITVNDDEVYEKEIERKASDQLKIDLGL